MIPKKFGQHNVYKQITKYSTNGIPNISFGQIGLFLILTLQIWILFYLE